MYSLSFIKSDGKIAMKSALTNMLIYLTMTESSGLVWDDVVDCDHCVRKEEISYWLYCMMIYRWWGVSIVLIF